MMRHDTREQAHERAKKHKERMPGCKPTDILEVVPHTFYDGKGNAIEAFAIEHYNEDKTILRGYY